MKASRVQECGSVDMSKYGHSQAKIKSKRHFFSLTFFHSFVGCFVVLCNAKQSLHVS